MSDDDAVERKPSMLALLPADVIACITDLLSYEDLRALILCCKAFVSKHVVHEEWFSSRSRLHIPVTGSTAFMDPIALQRLPTSYAVNDPSTLLTLRGLHDRVRSLKIQDARGSVVKGESFARPLTPLRSLTHLVELEIDTTLQPQVDVSEIHVAAPQLVRLCISVDIPTKVTNWHVLRNFTRLRVLKLQLWENWDMENNVGVPLLDELDIFGLYKIDIHNVSALAKFPPLRVLLLDLPREDGDPEFLQPMATHLPTLNKLCRHRKSPTAGVTTGIAASRIAAFSEEQIDIQALAALTSLERLSLRMHADATDCRPLRHLRKLRSLRLVDGWVRDFITCLPRLETLEVEDTGTEPRSFLEPEQPLEKGFQSPVRRVILVRRDGGELGESPFRQTVLQNAIEVTVACLRRADALIASIWSLRKIKRLAISCGPYFSWDLPHKFASLDCLEELYLNAVRCLPPEHWCLKRLRTLVANVVPSLDLVSKMTSLQRLCLPFYRAKDISPILSLHRLQEVSLPAACSCCSLRKARGSGGALPQLRRVLHPSVNCLLWDPCPRMIHSRTLYTMDQLKPSWAASQ